MSSKRFGLMMVLAAFLALHAYGLSHDGIEGFIAIFKTTNAWHMVLGADLLISLSLAATWLVRDARQRGVSSIPYVLLTIATGSAGPLLYLIRRRTA